jgi:hypothetical protein
MMRYAMVALLLMLGGCGGIRAAGPVPNGWKRVTIDHAFTIDMPAELRDTAGPQPIDRYSSDPESEGEMVGPERLLWWTVYGPRSAYPRTDLIEAARRHPVWSSDRFPAGRVNVSGRHFTNADSVLATHVRVVYRRRIVEASLLEPLPANLATTRMILGSIRILSDGE